MISNWQTWAALGVVAITAVLFVVRALRKRRSPTTGCGSGGDCGAGGSRFDAGELRKLQKRERDW